MIIVGEAVDRSGLTVNADIILTAFLAFFRHAQAAELPYGPLLGHAWISGTKFYVPAESTYPCPVAKSPATEWTVIVEDSTVGGAVIGGFLGGGGSRRHRCQICTFRAWRDLPRTRAMFSRSWPGR